MKLVPIPVEGIIGETALREAKATQFSDVVDLVQKALQPIIGRGLDFWTVAMYPDRAIARVQGGKLMAYPYTIDDANQVTIGTPYEVVAEHVPANAAMRESASGNPDTPDTPGEARATADGGEKNNDAAVRLGDAFIEALDPDAKKPSRYLVRVIRAGTSLNKVNYPARVLREAVGLFKGVRVFVKSDAEHLKGGGKDLRQLVGRLTEPRFVEAKGGGEIQAVLDVFDSSDVAPKLREAVERGMTELFGLSIDASGSSKKSGRFREATKMTKVDSVDLIIEPGAGGQLIRFAEAHNEDNTMLRSQMIKEIGARDAKRAESLAEASDDDVLTAYREAVAQPKPEQPTTKAGTETGNGVTSEQVAEQIRMVEARADARVSIAQAKLPNAIKDRLTQRFSEAASFTAEDVQTAIKDEREFLGKLNDGAKVQGLGDFIEAGDDRADKVQTMLDDFFDPKKPLMSFRECYAEITGDRKVTGLIKDVDRQRLREAAGSRFAEAVSSTTFSDILGDSITRAMIREYGNLEAYNDWRWMADVVPVNDFRTQERTRLGGYGNLPAVNEDAAYAALSTPGDEAASYKVTKRGGTETVSIETIANDDVGLIRRIPRALATAAGRTLYEFVYDFLDSNGNIYDGSALFVAGHNNLGTAALDATSFAAARLRMKQQTELSSGKRLGLTLRHLVIPSDLEETAYDLFVRQSNNDDTFVQSRKPTVHVVDYWTDANNWYGAADNAQVPLLEIGFYGGNEDPELFVQDSPTQGSLFSNDQIKYKIRHIYSGAVRDYRGFDGSIVA